VTDTPTPRTSAFAAIKRYAVLAYGAFGTMLDVGLMVLGAMLVGLAVAVLLAGFDIAETSMDLSTGAMLISAIVLAVTGMFCLGIASEGPLGRGRRLVGFKLWEVGIGRTLAVFGVGFGALLLYGVATRFLEGLPVPLHQGTEALRAVGVTGMTIMPLIGVPLSLLIRGVPVKYEWIHRADVPIMFIVWAVAAMTYLT
jgi:flagellar biosynthesis protein FliQ